MLFILTEDLGTGVFFIVAIAPLAALVTLLAIRWEPVGQDVDADDFEDANRLPIRCPHNTRKPPRNPP